MKRILISFVFICFYFMVVHAQQDWSVVAPNGLLTLKLANTDGHLTYRVVSGQEVIVRPSSLGIETTSNNFTTGLSFVKATSRRIDEPYTLLTGKRKNNHAVANETSVLFKTKSGALLQMDMRAYDDGVAFRYGIPKGAKRITITNERTEFAMPTDGKVWLQNYDLPTDYTPAYEGVYENGIAIGTKAKDSGGWAFPALFKAGSYWSLITESNLGANYFGTHLQQNCEKGIYKTALPMKAEAKGVGTITANSNTPFYTPWRTIIIGKELATIVESNLVYHLSHSNKQEDVSWVKPGRSSWSWWSDHASSKDFEKLKSFINLAKEMGWEYSLVDANWNIMEGGTIHDLIKYADSLQIGLWLWYNSGGSHNVVTEQPRNIMNDPQKRKEEFKKLRSWGVKGVKVDFFQSDKQQLMQLYHDILKDAAKEHIMVNFHGCTLPRGWSRMYPNLLSMEAVRGAENYGWGKKYAQTAPILHTILTYTRNVVGPMDYTPVTFSDYECCPHVTTNAHELALSVLFETGILHFADKVAAYQSLDNRIKDFMRTVPAVWDDTKFIQGYPGKETMLARRNGTTWYVAGINGEGQQKTLSLHLPFLSGNYKAILFSDGKEAREINVNELNLQQGGTLKINVLPNGGFTIMLTPAL